MARKKNKVIKGNKLNDLTKNKAIFEKYKNIIPAASSTLAKSPKRLFTNFSPFVTQSASGAHFTDIDGNDWLDCEMAMGTVVWGHARKEVNEEIIRQLNKGCHYSTPSILEYELADILLNRYPAYSAIKFFKNGADSVYAAVKAARYLTDKNATLSLEYHGWLDWSICGSYKLTPRDAGIPKNSAYNYLSCSKDALCKTVNDNKEILSSVVLCPANYTTDELSEVKKLCEKSNILLIFDEVTSGIRFGYGGATSAHGICPDFLCLSKGLTNGLPLAVVLGRKEHILLMEKLKISSAHAGENIALAAAVACEKLLQKNKECWPSWKPQTNEIIFGIEKTIKENGGQLAVAGNSGCFNIHSNCENFWTDPFREYMVKYLATKNIYSKGYILFSDVHTQNDINYVGENIYQCIIDYLNFKPVNSL